MTNREAARRALKALQKAADDTNHFDHGGYPSNEVLNAVADAIADEFKVALNRPRSS